MHNIEIKCELRDIGLARATCRSLKATHILSFDQTDTYFRVPDGRLKRRETTGEPTEWIFYERANRAATRLSHFMIYSEEQAKERYGSEPLPVWVVVKKRRELWMLGNTRIHLDEVEGLGTFIEFEALVSRDHNIARCHEAIASLREAFGPIMGEAIGLSYSDMVANQAADASESRPG